ncbi:HIRA-interacting protein 3-like [Narcine bancroftii]|uniref:HIRA-interacting protein 3-like n=1 Tax=Narcine bancroftii TaxID=1343680 RepID=UPI0038316856
MAERMQQFVSELMREDLGKLTHSIVQQRYQAHFKREALSSEEKAELRAVVERLLLDYLSSESSDDEPLIRKAEALRQNREREKRQRHSSGGSTETPSPQQKRTRREKKSSGSEAENPVRSWAGDGAQSENSLSASESDQVMPAFCGEGMAVCPELGTESGDTEADTEDNPRWGAENPATEQLLIADHLGSEGKENQRDGAISKGRHGQGSQKKPLSPRDEAVSEEESEKESEASESEELMMKNVRGTNGMKKGVQGTPRRTLSQKKMEVVSEEDSEEESVKRTARKKEGPSGEGKSLRGSQKKPLSPRDEAASEEESEKESEASESEELMMKNVRGMNGMKKKGVQGTPRRPLSQKKIEVVLEEDSEEESVKRTARKKEGPSGEGKSLRESQRKSLSQKEVLEEEESEDESEASESEEELMKNVWGTGGAKKKKGVQGTPRRPHSKKVVPVEDSEEESARRRAGKARKKDSAGEGKSLRGSQCKEGSQKKEVSGEESEEEKSARAVRGKGSGKQTNTALESQKPREEEERGAGKKRKTSAEKERIPRGPQSKPGSQKKVVSEGESEEGSGLSEESEEEGKKAVMGAKQQCLQRSERKIASQKKKKMASEEEGKGGGGKGRKKETSAEKESLQWSKNKRKVAEVVSEEDSEASKGKKNVRGAAKRTFRGSWTKSKPKKDMESEGDSGKDEESGATSSSEELPQEKGEERRLASESATDSSGEVEGGGKEPGWKKTPTWRPSSGGGGGSSREDTARSRSEGGSSGDEDSLPSGDEDGGERGGCASGTDSRTKVKPSAKKQSSGDREPAKEEHPSVRRLKRCLLACGVRRNYKKLFEKCHSEKSKVRVLREELANLGVQGNPTLEKCKVVRIKREEQAELDSLDISNIIPSEGRPRRRCGPTWGSQALDPYRRALGSDSEGDVPRKLTAWANLKGLISEESDSE